MELTNRFTASVRGFLDVRLSGIVAALILAVPPVISLLFAHSSDALSASCPYGAALPDGCLSAQKQGTIVDAHLADYKAVNALNIIGGTGYRNGTFTWTSSHGGCSVNAAGTITIIAGVIGNDNYTISSHGAGCTSRPIIFIPSQASGGRGGSITPSVYQLTPHNTPITYNLAGIDYPVGHDTALLLKDPTVDALPSCARFSGHTITVTTGDCSIDGWNFALHSSALVVSGGLSRVVITNNLFACNRDSTGDEQQVLVEPGPTDLMIKYNTFNGGSERGRGCISNGAIASVNIAATSGAVVFEYNYCFKPDSKCLNVSSGGSGTLAITEQYNFYAELGICGSSCSHGEAQYSFGRTTETLIWTSKFNVALNHFYSAPSNLTSKSAFVADQINHLNDVIEYNYILAMGNQAYKGSNNANGQVASAAFFCGHQEGGTNVGGIWRHNIVDYSGAFFPYNQSGATCARDFPKLEDVNAGTGHSCNTLRCD